MLSKPGLLGVCMAAEDINPFNYICVYLPMPDMKKIAFSVTNCICNDQRVLKMAGTVSQPGREITIIGRKQGDCCERDTVPYRTKRFSMLIQKGALFYMFYNIRLFGFLLFHRFDLLVSNDLDTLLPNWLISKIKRVPLIYDSHEYFTGVPELQDRLFVKWIWKTLERIMFPGIKNILTVSDSIGHQYELEYGIRPITVRNCSWYSGNIIPFSRTEMGISEDHLLLILQGTGINIDRGGPELIEAVKMVENVTLLIVGSGDMIGILKEKAGELNISDRVRIIPKVSWGDLMRYTRSADAGLSLDKDTNINYRFSLPNKLFDYISAGIAIIAGDLPEVSNIVNRNKCGIIIPEISSLAIASAIRRLQDDPGLLTELRKNAALASEYLNWDNESAKVKSLYDTLLVRFSLR
jgi:glycosyltransferase involved in cell wall biosynthesis